MYKMWSIMAYVMVGCDSLTDKDIYRHCVYTERKLTQKHIFPLILDVGQWEH